VAGNTQREIAKLLQGPWTPKPSRFLRDWQHTVYAGWTHQIQLLSCRPIAQKWPMLAAFRPQRTDVLYQFDFPSQPPRQFAMHPAFLVVLLQPEHDAAACGRFPALVWHAGLADQAVDLHVRKAGQRFLK